MKYSYAILIIEVFREVILIVPKIISIYDNVPNKIMTEKYKSESCHGSDAK
jgi:hypothetical protein